MNDGDILRLIPQRPPFVMIEKLLFADSSRADSSFLVSEDNVLAIDGFFSEAGIIENIAQTAALHAGYLAERDGKSSPQGIIGGVKGLNITRLPEVGEKLRTSISLENKVLNARILQGTISIEQEVIASCELKVFLF